MAIARSSPIIGAISGTLGSSTFRQTRYGLVIARHGRRVDSQTPPQQFRRAMMAALHLTWTGLSVQDRATWTNVAQNVTFPNRLGIPHRISPWCLFVHCNATVYFAPGAPNWSFQTTCSGIRCPSPSNFSATASLSSGFFTSADAPLVVRASTIEALTLAGPILPGQAYAPKSWIFIGAQGRFAPSIDWTTLTAPFLTSCQVGSTICARAIWFAFLQIPSPPVTTFLTITA